MAAAARYFVTDIRGTFIDWGVYFQGFSLAGKEIQVTGGAGNDVVAVQAGASADLTNLGGGANRILLSGGLLDYSQSIDQETGVYTFTRSQGLPPGGSEVVRFTVGDKQDLVQFSDGGIVIDGASDARLVDSENFTFNPIQAGWLDPQLSAGAGRPSGVSEASSALRVFIAGTEGLDVPALAQPGLAMSLVGSGGVDTVYVGAGTSVNATNLGGGNDRIYLSGNFAEYTQSIAQDTGVYTFTRVVQGKTERVDFTVGDQDDVVFFADGHIVINGVSDARLVDIGTFEFKAIQAAWLSAGGTPLPGVTVQISSNDPALKTGDAPTLTFTLDQDSTNFDVGDLVASGGTLSNFAGSGKVYTATFTPDAGFEGQAAVSVAAGKFTGTGGSPNFEATISLQVDTLAPTAPTVAAVTGDDVVSRAEQQAGFTLSGTNEAGSAVTVNGTSAEVLGTTWSLALTAAQVAALGTGNVTLALAATDAAGNVTATSKQVQITPTTVTYSRTAFQEVALSDGSITQTSTITLAGDTFAGIDNLPLIGATVTNVPAGLTAVVTKTGATTATLSFTGNATAHANANDVSNVTVTLSNAAFTLGNAAGVTGATKSDLAIDFADPLVRSVAYSQTTFAEAAANDGTITQTATITLTGDTFTGTTGQALAGAVVSNVPPGLTASVVKASDTTATLSFTGNATTHVNASDIANLTVTLGNDAFTLGSAGTVTGATRSNLAIDFADPVRTVGYSRTTFQEVALSDGSITQTSTITLTGDTFTGTDGAALTGATVTNVPAGLTAVVTKASDTTATLSFTGSATTHVNASDIANLTVTLGNAAFTLGSASTVTGATTSNLAVDFANPARSVSYSALRLLEGSDDDGSVTGSVVLTLSGDTFNGTNGVVLGGAALSNVPEGLTAVVTRTSATTATLTFTGSALANTDANDVGNVTLSLDDLAFSLGSASEVSGASRNDLAINFGDLGSNLLRGTAASNVIAGTAGDDVIHGLGGQDVINALGGDDSIDISDAGTTEAASATVVVSSLSNGLDAVSGFKGGATSAGGDVIDLSGIANLSANVSTGLSTASNFGASNVFVFDATPVSVEAAAAALAADADVTATQGYIVIADSARGGVTTIYHSSDLANNGTETALVMLSGVSTAALVAQNLLLSTQGT